MSKLAWPSFSAHSSLGSAIKIGGSADGGVEGVAGEPCSVPREGVDIKVGEAKPVAPGVGVLVNDRKAADGATVGDCSGDWINPLSGISTISGGSIGVDARMRGSGGPASPSS